MQRSGDGGNEGERGRGGRDRGKPEVSRVVEDRVRSVGIKRGPADLTWSPPRLQWGVKSRDAASWWWGSRAARVDQLGSPATRGSLTEKCRESRTNVRTTTGSLSLSLSFLGPATKTEFASALCPPALLDEHDQREARQISVEGVSGDKRALAIRKESLRATRKTGNAVFARGNVRSLK